MASDENDPVIGDIGAPLGVASNAPPVFSRVNDWRTISAAFVGKRK
jgi:hypothetical protein